MPMEPTAAISVQFKSLSGYMATAITTLTTINTAVAAISGQYTDLLAYTSGTWKEVTD